MTHLVFRIKGIFIALISLALSASLAFGAQPPTAASSGLENAASHAGKTVPVAGGDTETTGHEEGDDEEGGHEEGDDEEGDGEEGDEEAVEGDEEAVEGDESEEAGDNCLTDPTVLTDEELDAMRHGSIVCWAAHQETPEGYDSHGAWVSEWAHSGKGSGAADEAKAMGQGHGKGQGKSKHQTE